MSYCLSSKEILIFNPCFWRGHGFVFDAPDKKRKKEIAFHVKANDYFGTLATVVCLLKQSKRKDKKLLEKIADELEFMQTEYDIKEKGSA